MVVGVDEPGQHQAPFSFDDLGVRPDPRRGPLVVTDPGDAPVAHGERLGPGQAGVDGVDPGSAQNECRGRGGGGARCHLWCSCVVLVGGASECGAGSTARVPQGVQACFRYGFVVRRASAQ